MTATTTYTDRLMTPIEAAAYLNVAAQTLAVWRGAKRYNLPYVRCGRSIRYRLRDLESWAESRTVGACADAEK